MQYDFRSVYASLLQDWFCVPSADLNTIMLQNFQTLPLVNASACATAIHEIDKAAGMSLVNVYPNPFVTSCKITFTTFGGHTLLQVFNCEGQVMKTLMDAVIEPGEYTVSFANEGYATGVYYARLQNHSVQQVKSMVIVR